MPTLFFRHHQRRGYSLLEIIFVLVLLAILGAVIVPNTDLFVDGGADDQTQLALQAVDVELEQSLLTQPGNTYPGTNSSELVNTLSAAELTFQTTPSTAYKQVSIDRRSDTEVVAAMQSNSGACWVLRIRSDGPTNWAADSDYSSCDAASAAITGSTVRGTYTNPTGTDDSGTPQPDGITGF